MKPNIDTSLSRQHAKLAARPKCGFAWTVGKGIWIRDHLCVKHEGHAGRNHRCTCGTTKRKLA